ncbi:MAG: hydrogenase iron-sulfur subunit [Deltaproteobacteria bacterium]|nr:hydrogenase iron-sulfur subunit [Deltaproteobacteria bacterium]
MTIKLMTFLQELLSFVGLGDRLHLDWISSAEAQKFVQVVTDFTEKVKGMGPSPLSNRFDLAAILSLTESMPEAVGAEGG